MPGRARLIVRSSRSRSLPRVPKEKRETISYRLSEFKVLKILVDATVFAIHLVGVVSTCAVGAVTTDERSGRNRRLAPRRYERVASRKVIADVASEGYVSVRTATHALVSAASGKIEPARSLRQKPAR
jgi:hypothetical protein